MSISWGALLSYISRRAPLGDIYAPFPYSHSVDDRYISDAFDETTRKVVTDCGFTEHPTCLNGLFLTFMDKSYLGSWNAPAKPHRYIHTGLLPMSVIRTRGLCKTWKNWLTHSSGAHEQNECVASGEAFCVVLLHLWRKCEPKWVDFPDKATLEHVFDAVVTTHCLATKQDMGRTTTMKDYLAGYQRRKEVLFTLTRAVVFDLRTTVIQGRGEEEEKGSTMATPESGTPSASRTLSRPGPSSSSSSTKSRASHSSSTSRHDTIGMIFDDMIRNDKLFTDLTIFEVVDVCGRHLVRVEPPDESRPSPVEEEM